MNTGTAPLDLSTASVVSISDDSDEVAWALTKFSGSTIVLPPGQASGCLSPLAAPAGTTYHAQAVIRIDGVDIVVPFTIHTAPTNGTTGARFDGTKRISTQP